MGPSKRASSRFRLAKLLAHSPLLLPSLLPASSPAFPYLALPGQQKSDDPAASVWEGLSLISVLRLVWAAPEGPYSHDILTSKPLSSILSLVCRSAEGPALSKFKTLNPNPPRRQNKRPMGKPSASAFLTVASTATPLRSAGWEATPFLAGPPREGGGVRGGPFQASAFWTVVPVEVPLRGASWPSPATRGLSSSRAFGSLLGGAARRPFGSSPCTALTGFCTVSTAAFKSATASCTSTPLKMSGGGASARAHTHTHTHTRAHTCARVWREEGKKGGRERERGGAERPGGPSGILERHSTSCCCAYSHIIIKLTMHLVINAILREP
jgi:hypothetical protein